MHHATPSRKHPAEVVLGALLRGRSVDLPDGRTYRLGDDLTLGPLSLPTLLRAARKPEAQRFTLLRDVLRKRRAANRRLAHTANSGQCLP